MKYVQLTTLSMCFFLLCGCTFFYPKQSSTDPVMLSPKPLVVPVGKNWQVKEEAPKLSSETGRLPFQTEQSLQPEGEQPGAPSDNRRIDTSR